MSANTWIMGHIHKILEYSFILNYQKSQLSVACLQNVQETYISTKYSEISHLIELYGIQSHAKSQCIPILFVAVSACEWVCEFEHMQLSKHKVSVIPGFKDNIPPAQKQRKFVSRKNASGS